MRQTPTRKRTREKTSLLVDEAVSAWAWRRALALRIRFPTRVMVGERPGERMKFRKRLSERLWAYRTICSQAYCRGPGKRRAAEERRRKAHRRLNSANPPPGCPCDIDAQARRNAGCDGGFAFNRTAGCLGSSQRGGLGLTPPGSAWRRGVNEDETNSGVACPRLAVSPPCGRSFRGSPWVVPARPGVDSRLPSSSPATTRKGRCGRSTVKRADMRRRPKPSCRVSGDPRQRCAATKPPESAS